VICSIAVTDCKKNLKGGNSWPRGAHAVRRNVRGANRAHGEKGYSEQPVVPSLGGQPAPYLLIQLYLFRENQRASTYRKGDRMVEIMSEMTKGFTDDDLRKFSDFLSRLPPPPRLHDTSDPARMMSGRALISEHRCNSCHNLDLTGAKAFRTSQINARTSSPRRCANIGTTSGTAMTA
jgi:cytochrome c553